MGAKYTARVIERFHDSYTPVPECGCWIWDKAEFGGGYGWFFIKKESGKRHSEKAHRASWEIHNGPISDGLHVLHRCDTPLCVNPDHLFLGTNADNIADRLSKKRPKSGLRGEAHLRAKLNWADVEHIRSSASTTAALAREYGVAWSTVHAVRSGRTWRVR